MSVILFFFVLGECKALENVGAEKSESASTSDDDDDDDGAGVGVGKDAADEDQSPKSEFPDTEVKIDFSASGKSVEFKATRASVSETEDRDSGIRFVERKASNPLHVRPIPAPGKLADPVDTTLIRPLTTGPLDNSSPGSLRDLTQPNHVI